ncbi:MAG: hypothetical protein ACK6D3_11460 [Planctomycetaceae bacterium]|jgi:hypothetical protein
MLTGNYQLLLSLILSGIVSCSHVVALLFCFRYRYFSWAMPVLILGLLGRISTGLVFLANSLSMLSGNGLGAVTTTFGSLLLSGAQFINVAATILMDLGLILLLVDVARQFQMWREAAGTDDSLDQN